MNFIRNKSAELTSNSAVADRPRVAAQTTVS